MPDLPCAPAAPFPYPHIARLCHKLGWLRHSALVSGGNQVFFLVDAAGVEVTPRFQSELALDSYLRYL